MSKFINTMPTLNIFSIFKRKSEDGYLALFEKEKTIPFAFGRDAIKVLAQYIKQKNNKKVLLPSYICDVAILPFIGILDFVFYEIDETFIVKPEHIKSKLDSTIGLVLLVDYFGFEQPYKKEIMELCHLNDVELFEDLAHKLPVKTSQYQTNKVIGDYGLYSIHKQLPLTDGSLLIINDVQKKNSIEKFSTKRRTLYRSARTLFKILRNNYFGETPPSVAKSESYNYLPDVNVMWGGRPKPFGNRISWLGLFVLRTLNQTKTFNKRMEIYNFYAKHIHFGKNVTPIKLILEKSDSPFVFPVLINNASQDVRIKLQTELPGYFWPRLYTGLRLKPDENSKTISLAERVYYLTIQQNLTHDELLSIVNKFNLITSN